MVIPRGFRFGKYEIIEPLDHGSMACVYKVRAGDSPAALKIPHSQYWNNQYALDLFETEGKSLLPLRHANIVLVRAFGKQNMSALGIGGALPYLVMDYVAGSSLDQYLHQFVIRNSTPTMQSIISILSPLASALDYIHAQKLVHRDVKPGNIRITRQNQPILVDFGIVQTGQNLSGAKGSYTGSPWYMSPEQAAGQAELSGASDQYALAIVAYEMLSGSPPFEGADSQQIRLRQISEEPPMLPSWSLDLQLVLARGLAKDPSQRYNSCRELINTMATIGH